MAEPTGAYLTPKPWPEGASPTPGQALQWLRACNVDEGKAVLARLQEHEETAIRCWIMNHEGRIDGDQVRLYDLIRQREAVLAIRPEEHATKSRDYGRGFAEALRLVREAMSARDDSPHGRDPEEHAYDGDGTSRCSCGYPMNAHGRTS